MCDEWPGGADAWNYEELWDVWAEDDACGGVGGEVAREEGGGVERGGGWGLWWVWGEVSELDGWKGRSVVCRLPTPRTA